MVIESAVILALLGAIDSLLTSLVADNMTQTRHDSNRELIGQGIGNSVAGLFGGIPGAGATIRTVVNVRSGGTTRLSGAIHSLLLLTVVLVLGPVASQIPQAVLAGILVKVGWDILDLEFIKRAVRGPRWDISLMVLVLGLTVFVDLITAVAVGVVLAALAFVKRLADHQLDELDASSRTLDLYEQDLHEQGNGRVAIFEFAGPLSFGAAADLSHRARGVMSDETEVLLLDFERVPYFDSSAARAISSVTAYAIDVGVEVFAVGLNDEAREVLEVYHADRDFTGSYATRGEALASAKDS